MDSTSKYKSSPIRGILLDKRTDTAHTPNSPLPAACRTAPGRCCPIGQAPLRTGSPVKLHQRLERVYALRKIGAAAHSVLLCLAWHSNQIDRCFPSVGTIAKETSLSLRTVQRALERLRSFGLIGILPRDHRANLYVLALPPVKLAVPPVKLTPITVHEHRQPLAKIIRKTPWPVQVMREAYARDHSRKP